MAKSLDICNLGFQVLESGYSGYSGPSGPEFPGIYPESPDWITNPFKLGLDLTYLFFRHAEATCW